MLNLRAIRETLFAFASLRNTVAGNTDKIRKHRGATEDYPFVL
jgi:hypothetical protein